MTARAAPLVVAPIAAVTGLPGRRSAVPLYIYDGDQEFWPPAEGARTRHREQCALGAASVHRGVPKHRTEPTPSMEPNTRVPQRLSAGCCPRRWGGRPR
ncbi:hypothetical protein [Nocardia farcinica]|uniref:hypothetical protein n=1 Tax=Nocardia farcinica TaxID=37329 RepID=UPI00245748EE|nr:hypothetical protein [Nocardia farcinica]